MVELGISTFGETTELEGTGQTYSHAERIRQLLAEIELADKIGLDVYGIGEHHRADFAVSAPEIILAAGAVNTKKIRLTSAVSFSRAWIRFVCSNNMPLSMLCQMDVRRLWLEGVLSRNLFPCLAMI